MSVLCQRFKPPNSSRCLRPPVRTLASAIGHLLAHLLECGKRGHQLLAPVLLRLPCPIHLLSQCGTLFTLGTQLLTQIAHLLIRGYRWRDLRRELARLLERCELLLERWPRRRWPRRCRIIQLCSLSSHPLLRICHWRGCRSEGRRSCIDLRLRYRRGCIHERSRAQVASHWHCCRKRAGQSTVVEHANRWANIEGGWPQQRLVTLREVVRGREGWLHSRLNLSASRATAATI